ncbi:uncharacterized protein [Palaemon carinicauda]|uniref:uncharacterized protein n=1 Tax=Palaemon carinicauda TaxID=392227 RepID=UPI0035B59D7C
MKFLGRVVLISMAAMVVSTSFGREKRQANSDDVLGVEEACNTITRPAAVVAEAFAPGCAKENNFVIQESLIKQFVVSPQSQNGSDYMLDLLSHMEVPEELYDTMFDCLVPKMTLKVRNFLNYHRSAGHLEMAVSFSDLSTSFDDCDQNNGTAIFECYEEACVYSLKSAQTSVISW